MFRIDLTLLATASCILLLAPHARSEVPLFEQDPYDRITLDRNNENAVLNVMPLDVPELTPPDATGRRVPDPLPKGGKFQVQLLDRPGSKYEVAWHAIDQIELFNDMVLKKAEELVRGGRLDEAYEYFDFLTEEDPELPGLNRAIEDYLYEEAKASQSKEQYEEALAMLRELFERNPGRERLDTALGLATEKLVEGYVAADNYWTARQMLRNLADLLPDHPVVTKWESRFQEEATGQLAEGRKAEQAGGLREAHQAGRRLMHVWPDLPEGRQFIDSIQAQYPRIVVGVTLPAAAGEPGRLDDWAARRTGRLLYRTLTEFVGRSVEGGKYHCPVGQVEIEELGLRLAFQIEPDLCESVGAGGLTGYDLARQLLDMTTPGHPTYRLDWAELLDRVSVRDVYRVEADLRRPHVRPEALFETVAVGPGRRMKDEGGRMKDERGETGDLDSSFILHPSSFSGPYVVESRSEDEAVYLVNPQYSAGPRQPKEIVERYSRKGTEAITALERRQIDVLDRVNPWDLDRLASVAGVVVEPYAVPVVHCLVPNPRRPFTARRAFRRALCYGIHREAVLAHLLRGARPAGCQVVSGPFPLGISRDDPLDYAYDHSIEPRGYEPHLAIGLAQVALSEVAAVMEKQGVEVADLPELVLAHPAHEIARVACTSIQQQLDLVDIRVTLRELPAGLPARIPDDVDLLYAELSMREPVVDARRLLGEEGISGSASSFMSQALRQLDQATDWAQVAGRLRHVHRLAHEEVSVVPLWQLTDHFAYHRSLEGVGTGPMSLYQNVEAWQPATQYAAEAK
ncbi:MAG: ABC transporter substrate-binding protein [Planctomycetota bacterium]